MTIHELHHIKPLLNVRRLCDEAELSYGALSAKLHRYGAQGRKSELTAPESRAIDAALARLFRGAGLELQRPDTPTKAASGRGADR